MSPAGADGIAMFGFVTGFLTLVVLGYRSRLRTRFPVLAVCLECCAVYGFLSSDWMLGFCLMRTWNFRVQPGPEHAAGGWTTARNVTRQRQ